MWRMNGTRGRFGGWLLAVLLLTVSLPAGPGPFPYARMGAANGCFVESVAFGDMLRVKLGEGGWYRLLQWGAKEADEVVAGHAVVVFEHQGALWSYDINHGFNRLEVPTAEKDDVARVAEEVTAPYREKITPRYPVYRQDFPQEADPAPPVPDDGADEREVRDAVVVAVRLAARRPVKLVEFDYPKDGVLRRAAAVAFVYNGRLCVYTPTGGTVPFKARALSVENLRQLQELLRRMHPGATNLKAR